MEQQPGEIFKAIPRVMAEIAPIAKGQLNQQQGFKFRGIDDVYNALHSILSKNKVFTAAEIMGRERQELQTKSGGRAWHVVIHFKFKFYAEDGSFIEAWADGEAMDTGDKASNKCASIAHKYALIQTLCIPTADLEEPDRTAYELGGDSNAKPAPQQQQSQPQQGQRPVNPVSENQIKRLYAISKKAHMRDEEVKRLASQMFHVEHYRDLDQNQYNQLCNLIEQKSNRSDSQASDLTKRYSSAEQEF